MDIHQPSVNVLYVFCRPDVFTSLVSMPAVKLLSRGKDKHIQLKEKLPVFQSGFIILHSLSNVRHFFSPIDYTFFFFSKVILCFLSLFSFPLIMYLACYLTKLGIWNLHSVFAAWLSFLCQQ